MKRSPGLFFSRLLIVVPLFYCLATQMRGAEWVTMEVTAEEQKAILQARAQPVPLKTALKQAGVARAAKAAVMEEVAEKKKTKLLTLNTEASQEGEKKIPPNQIVDFNDYDKATPFFAGTRYKFVESLVDGAAYDAEAQVLRRALRIAPRKSSDDNGWFAEAFRLRRSWDPVKLFQFDVPTGKWVETPTSGTASDGAEFGWQRDGLTSTDSTTADGVAYFPILFHSSEDRQMVFIPGVEFHRDTGTDGGPNVVNSLIPRLGIDFNLVKNAAIPGLAKGAAIRTSLGYQTDFNFDGSQWIFDIEGEFINEAQGIGLFSPRANSEAEANVAKETGKPDSDRWKQVIHIPGLPYKAYAVPILSFASIQDIASSRSLAQLQDMTYATVGFRAGLDVEMEWLRRSRFLAGFATTKLGFEYRTWTTVGGSDTQSFEYLDAHMEIPFLGSSDKINLRAFYRYGDTPDTLERADLLGLVLTAKF